ncbi:N-ethylammeline chlorohydrolase [Aliigemmobacter aestuarii]|uniref:N-ethylammeline chlorohydrolase n=1 Tax=Aliigemmobacter aestuarii TaxID=1445661 RepID=A0A4S3MII0_9RHOB|nr:chlorohydrolase family protein [Gemmobacter aestuarii]THD80838.1 N-ethylammeline chlorohydrolase [Gemmobacter aestuarii]
MRTLLSADWVVGFDGRDHCLIPGGEVVFSGPVIEFVGRGFPGPVDRRIDFGRAMIGPGFIDLDALGDLDTEVLCFDNGPGRKLGRIWTEEALQRGPQDAYTPEEELFKYRYAFTQLIRNGITTALPITSMLYRAWAESYDEMAGVAAIAEEIGIRAYLGPCYMSGLTYQRSDGSLAQHWDEARGLAGLADAARFIADFDGRAGGRIRAFLAPDRIETQLPSVLARTVSLQRETDVPMRLHCCQSVYEFETVLAMRGHSPLGWLESLGLLTERAILPHGIYISGHPQVSRGGDDDMQRLVASGVTVAHCPVVFARDGEALDSFSSYLAQGVRFGMGTDTHPADMVENIRLGRILSALMDGEAKATAADFYRAATLGGADALGRPNLGRLAAGARADITVFDLTGFHLGQVLDPIKAMTLAGTGRDFRASFIDGREVMADFTVAGSNVATLTAAADAQILKARAIHADRAPDRPQVQEIFRPSFRVLD